jgi:hypothetical protein
MSVLKTTTINNRAEVSAPKQQLTAAELISAISNNQLSAGKQYSQTGNQFF